MVLNTYIIVQTYYSPLSYLLKRRKEKHDTDTMWIQSSSSLEFIGSLHP